MNETIIIVIILQDVDVRKNIHSTQPQELNLNISEY